MYYIYMNAIPVTWNDLWTASVEVPRTWLRMGYNKSEARF